MLYWSVFFCFLVVIKILPFGLNYLAELLNCGFSFVFWGLCIVLIVGI